MREDEASYQNQEGARAQLDASVVSGLGPAAVHSRDPCFVDADDPVHEIEGKRPLSAVLTSEAGTGVIR